MQIAIYLGLHASRVEMRVLHDYLRLMSSP